MTAEGRLRVAAAAALGSCWEWESEEGWQGGERRPSGSCLPLQRTPLPRCSRLAQLWFSPTAGKLLQPLDLIQILVGGSILHPSLRALAGVSMHMRVNLWVRGEFCALLSRADSCDLRHSLDTLQSRREDPPSYPFMSTPLSHPSVPSLTPRDRRSHHLHNCVILGMSYKWNRTVGELSRWAFPRLACALGTPPGCLCTHASSLCTPAVLHPVSVRTHPSRRTGLLPVWGRYE